MQRTRTGRHLARRLSVAAAALLGCSNGSRPSDADVHTDASIASPDVLECERRLAGAPDGPPRSFELDVMPLFGLSCNFGSCHAGAGTLGHLLLGPKCSLSDASETCRFEQGALTPDVLDRVHAALLGPSLRGGHLPRVEPGRPDESFLLVKLANCHEVLGDASGCGERCGGEMPPNMDFFDSSPDRYRVLLEWVTQGAPR